MDNHEQRAPVIWLRQSARFTLGEQRRTVEITIPVRPGASKDEIERLLREADAGMEALTRHLDGRIASLIGEAGANGAAKAVAPSPVAPTPAPTSPVTHTTTLARDDAAASASSRPTAAAPARPAAPAAAHATPPASADRPLSPRPAPPTAASSNSPAPRPTSPAATSAEPLDRPAFLAETRTLGLNPKQVMDRLQVRSLDGLNYREALELLRRQMLDEAGAAPASTAPSAPSASARPAPPPAITRFDEEDDDEADDVDITFSLPDGSEPSGYDEGDLDGMPDSGVADNLDAMSDLDDLDEIPDVADVAEAPAAPSASSATRRARELLERLRGITPGSAGTPDQIKAYTNLIVGQLDATQAGTLVRGIWGVAPNRLGSDQLYELIRWGKEDAFAEEVPVVLAVLAADRAKGDDAGSPRASGNAARDAAPPARPARPARGTRASGTTGGDA